MCLREMQSAMSNFIIVSQMDIVCKDSSLSVEVVGAAPNFRSSLNVAPRSKRIKQESVP